MPDLELAKMIAELERVKQSRDSTFPIAIHQNRLTETEAARRNEHLNSAISRLRRELDCDSPALPITKPSQRERRRAKPLLITKPGKINQDLRSKLALPTDEPQISLSEARSRLADSLASGMTATNCPCCGQLAAVYSRGLTGSHIAVLRLLAERGPMTAAQIAVSRELAGKGRDFSLMRHFGLIDRDGQSWAITNDGRAFLAGDMAIPHKVILWDNRLLGVDDSMTVKVGDVSGVRFDINDIEADASQISLPA